MRMIIAAVTAALTLTSCVQSSAMRVSQNEAIIQTSAEAMCGATGALKAAEKQAAIETIKAGYDRYIITAASSANNVHATQMPGTYNTYGRVSSYGGFGTVNATTTYTPGPIIYGGSHDQAVGVRMFAEGEPGASNAISARETLGPKWATIARDGVRLCN
ncbi:MAG: hypothetical protein H2046_06485 [Rhizobiales bacterium]|nr:hypothetical protein [Hyphomicrobiales bacterium]